MDYYHILALTPWQVRISLINGSFRLYIYIYGFWHLSVLVHLSTAFDTIDHKPRDRNVWNGSQLAQVVFRRIVFGQNGQNPVQSLNTLDTLLPRWILQDKRIVYHNHTGNTCSPRRLFSASNMNSLRLMSISNLRLWPPQTKWTILEFSQTQICFSGHILG